MKRTMIVMFALAMLLAWTGSAMAQFHYLDETAERNCHPTDREAWFNGSDATTNLLAVFPYFAAVEDGFWSGMAVINKDEAYTIQPNTLCVVAYDGRNGAAKRIGSPVYPRNMFVTLVDQVGTEEVWENRVYVGLYAKNKAKLVAEGVNYAGFGMMGNGAEGQGYFTKPLGDTDGGTLEFDYVTEGAPWWRGLAIVNKSDQRQYVKITVFQGDTSASTVVEIERGEIWTGLVDDIDGVDATKRAFIVVEEVLNRDGDVKGAKDDALMGFAMFGNGNEALGYLPDAQ